MKIILDCMGGDNSPVEMIKGAVMAKAELGEDYILVGDEKVIREEAEKLDIDLSGFEICHADEVITMHDDAMSVMKEKNNSSMAEGLKLLAAGEGDAFVSCGNTGALFSGATLIVKRTKGIHRSAIASMLPFENPVLLLDSGANVVVQPEHLVEFAVMGSAYMQSSFGVDFPRVGLLSNGTEETKGTPVLKDAYAKLKETAGINFIGYVEGGDALLGGCDVLVADGFTGNVFLKTMEGAGKLVMKRMKGIFMSNIKAKLSAVLIKKQLRGFKHSFDVTEFGGSPILGISKPVIKAHGSSNAKAFKNAIKQARDYAASGAIEKMAAVMSPETKN